MEKKLIDYRFKILYAVAMIMVVCSHVFGGGISIISDWFPYDGLHLAIFVFCSGYFYKRKSESKSGKYVLRKICKLLVPLYIYNIVYGLIVYALRYKGFEIGGGFTLNNLLIAPITNGHQFAYNMGGWFIIPLFMIEVYNVCIRKLLSRINKNIPEVGVFTINIVLGLVGNQLACLGYRNGWWLVLVRMLYFVPFYGLGIFYKNFLEYYFRRIPSFWYFSTIFAIKLIIAYIYGRMPSYIPSWCKNFTEGPVMPIIIGYLGILFWLRIATILEPAIGKSIWLNLIADNTYSIMMNQFLGFMIVKTIYALLSKVVYAFADFDWISYKTDIWWYYRPKGVNHTLIIYVIVGIVFSIIIQKLVNLMKYKMVAQLKVLSTNKQIRFPII